MEIITTIQNPPRTTLSIDSQLYLGQDQIRRNVSRNTTLYIGDTTNDRFITIAGGDTMMFQESLPMGALCLVTTAPITVTIDDTLIIEVRKLLFLDMETMRKVQMENAGASDAVVHVTYIL